MFLSQNQGPAKTRNFGIEKANGVKVLLNREIKENIRVSENKAEIKKIDADIVKWNRTIKVSGEKRVILEAQIAKVEEQIAKMNSANKARRLKRRAEMKAKNERHK